MVEAVKNNVAYVLLNHRNIMLTPPTPALIPHRATTSLLLDKNARCLRDEAKRIRQIVARLEAKLAARLDVEPALRWETVRMGFPFRPINTPEPAVLSGDTDAASDNPFRPLSERILQATVEAHLRRLLVELFRSTCVYENCFVEDVLERIWEVHHSEQLTEHLVCEHDLSLVETPGTGAVVLEPDSPQLLQMFPACIHRLVALRQRVRECQRELKVIRDQQAALDLGDNGRLLGYVNRLVVPGVGRLWVRERRRRPPFTRGSLARAIAIELSAESDSVQHKREAWACGGRVADMLVQLQGPRQRKRKRWEWERS